MGVERDRVLLAARLAALPRLLEEALALEAVAREQLGRELLEQPGRGERRQPGGVHDGDVGRRAADRRQRELRVVGVAPRQDQLAHVAVRRARRRCRRGSRSGARRRRRRTGARTTRSALPPANGEPVLVTPSAAAPSTAPPIRTCRRVRVGVPLRSPSMTHAYPERRHWERSHVSVLIATVAACGRPRCPSIRRSPSATSTSACSARSSSTWAAACTAGSTSRGTRRADADGFRGDVLELVRELGRDDRALPRRQLRLGLRLGGRHRAARVAAAAARPRLALDRDQPGRHRRVPRLGAARPASSRCSRSTWARAASTPPGSSSSTATRPPAREWADRRPGDPYGVRVWCIGNEMDGPWQIGHKDAVAYGKLANEAGKAMRLVDPSIELVVCGSSHSRMPTFGAWEDTVLDLAWEVADHVSLHTYYDPARFESTEAFLASLARPRPHDRRGRRHRRRGRRRKGSRRRVSLSVDEWNVWYQEPSEAYERKREPFVEAPPLIEDTYTVTDALVVGCCLITLLRHADRVRMACLAQLVNVIAPIRTERRRPGLAPDDLLPVPARGSPRPRDRPARGAERPDLRHRGRERRAGAGGHRRPRRRRGADAVRGQPRRRAARAARTADRPRLPGGRRAPRARRRRSGGRQHRRAAGSRAARAPPTAHASRPASCAPTSRRGRGTCCGSCAPRADSGARAYSLVTARAEE